MENTGLQAPAVPAPPPPWAPEQPAQQAQHIPQLNWSHFKPEFSEKAEEDAEAHLLRANNWMDTYQFQEGVKVQRFCLTLAGEARLWYESLRHIKCRLARPTENQFRQQYSKIGSTREQLFHAWHSFHFDENTETLDVYVTCIRQVTILLGYGQPQILQAFKNTLPTKLYWVLFPLEDLRVAVETAKRILTKERIDRQLAEVFIYPIYKYKRQL